jgi:N-acetylneuraminic acid mutarotase
MRKRLCRSRALVGADWSSAGLFVEPLERRVLCHDGPGDFFFGDRGSGAVPWLTAPYVAPVQSPTPTPTPSPSPSPSPTPTPTPTPTPADFTQIRWTTKASSPLYRAEALTATIDGKIYVFGGFAKDANGEGPIARSDVYDPASDTWSRIADMPRAYSHVGVAVDGHDVYFCGGYYGTQPGTYAQVFGTNEVWRYNVDSNTYTPMPALPAALAGGGAAIIGRQLHYFGGFELSRQDVNVHYVLDLDNPSAGWHTAAPMLLSTNHLGAVTFGGKIYAIAGQTGHDENLVTRDDVQIYDPATDRWTAGAPMPAPRSHMASATFVMGDRILVISGESANGVETDTVFAYTPATNSWQTLTPLPALRFSGVGAVVNGRIYYTTGGNAATYEGTPVG